MTRFTFAAKSNPPFKTLLLFGPTAVGKTAIIEELFPERGEVINADSMQVYQEISIGTAKPEKSLTDKIPHHLVDCLSVKEQFDIGTFVREADRLIPEINSRERIPVISGGTAFYFKHLIFGLPPVPAIDPSVREKVNQMLNEKGLPALYIKLSKLDPIRAEQLHATDTARIVRALEVCLQTGKKHSDFALPTTPRDFINPLVIGLTRERSELYERINRRVEIMFNEGLTGEWITALRNGAEESDPGMRGIGYREFFTFTPQSVQEEIRSTGNNKSINQLLAEEIISKQVLNKIKEEIQKNTRRYAKRQLTFFKSIPGVRWITLDENNPSDNKKAIDSLKEQIDRFFQTQ